VFASADLGHGPHGIVGVDPIDDVTTVHDHPIIWLGGKTVEGEE
jgi:hypothetical protein